MNDPLEGVPIDVSRLRPAPRPSGEASVQESIARALKTGDAPFWDLSHVDITGPEGGSEGLGPEFTGIDPSRVEQFGQEGSLDMLHLSAPVPANLQLPPMMSHTAAFAQVPDWLPLSKRSAHRRAKSQTSERDPSAPIQLSRQELKG